MNQNTMWASQNGPGDSMPPMFAFMLRILRRAPMPVTFSVMACLVVAGFIALALPHKYTSTVQLLVDPRGLQLVDRDVTARSQTTDAMMAVVESQARIITSDNLLRELIRRESLTTDPEFGLAAQSGAMEKLTNALLRAFAGRQPITSEDGPTLEAIRRAITAKRAERSYILEASVTAKSADRAARLANAVAQLFLESEISARADSARRASGSLANRLDELRQRVQSAEDAAETYKAQNNIVGASGRLVSEQQLSDLTTQLASARARTAELRARYEQVEKLRKAGGTMDGTTEAIQSNTIGQLRNQIAELKRQESELLSTLGPRHPNLAPVQEQIRGLERLISEELARITRTVKADFERAQASEGSLSASLDQMKQSALTTSQSFVRLRELERDVEASRAVYESYLKRAREIGEQEQIDTSNIRVISPALPPIRPDNSKAPLILLGSLVFGLAIGFAIAFAQEMRSGSLFAAPVAYASVQQPAPYPQQPQNWAPPLAPNPYSRPGSWAKPQDVPGRRW